MRALITRPSEDSTAIAERLEALGIEPVIEPLMTVEPMADVEVDLDGVQAILLTSRNGARAITGATDRRDVPVYAVGDSTAELAREAGFETVESAGGDSEALAMLVRERLEPKDGALLHAAGAAVAGDLAGVLAGDGFDVRRQELYATKPVAALSVATSGMLSDGGIDLVLFFSPRTAQTFVDLVNQAGLDKASADMTAVCLSRAVARSVGALQWREVQVAERPNMRAMIEVAASAGAEPEPNETQLEEDDDMAEASTPPSAEDRQPWGAVAEPPPAHPRRRWGGGLAAGVVVVAIAAAGVYYWPLLAPRLGQQAGAPVAVADRAPPQASDALAGRIASLEAAVKSLRTGALARLEASAGEAASEVTRVAGRLEAAERAIAEAGRDDGAATDARIGAIEMAMGDVRKVLTARLDGLDTRVSGLASGAADGVGGTARLRAENDRLKTTLATLTERMATLEAFY